MSQHRTPPAPAAHCPLPNTAWQITYHRGQRNKVRVKSPAEHPPIEWRMSIEALRSVLMRDWALWNSTTAAAAIFLIQMLLEWKRRARTTLLSVCDVRARQDSRTSGKYSFIYTFFFLIKKSYKHLSVACFPVDWIYMSICIRNVSFMPFCC